MSDDQPADPGRRQFFRRLGRETAASAGRAVGAVDQARRGGSAMASELLGYGLASPARSAARLGGADNADTPTAPAGFASAYRLSGDALVLLDQRLLPEGRGEVTCREPTELATAFRVGVVGGGPVLGEIAAYAIALVARRASGRPTALAAGRLEAAATTLAGARPNVRALHFAVERMIGAYRADPPDPAASLLAEADSIAVEAAASHAAIGRIGADLLAQMAPDRLHILLHGEMGPLSCGLVGTGLSIVRALSVAGRPVHVYVTEGGPRAEGRRVTALQLAQLDLPHTVVPDVAVAWLLGSRPVHAVLLRGDTVFAGGDVCGPLGTASVAQLAAGAGVPVHAVASTRSVEVSGATGGEAALELGSQGGLAPLTDVAPAALVDGLITELGVLRPPYGPA